MFESVNMNAKLHTMPAIRTVELKTGDCGDIIEEYNGGVFFQFRSITGAVYTINAKEIK